MVAKVKVSSENFLRKVIDKLIEDGYIVYAPVKVGNYHLFKEVKSGNEADFEYINTRKSPKEVLFPENEVLIKYGEWIEEVPSYSGKRAIVGIRSCDARAIKLLDEIFLSDFVDPYYEDRRRELLLVGYSCNKVGEYCFCESVGINATGGDDVDVLVTDIGDKQIVEVISEKGEEIVSKLSGILSDAGEDEIRAKDELERSVKESFIRKIGNIDEIRKVMREIFDGDYWKEVAMNCVGCGACTYLCPTCFCFDIVDEGEIRGCRWRIWDSCQFPLYTLETSSHNPRSEKWQRLRNRFYDKFYYTVERKGDVYCVGCGRCIENCPVGVDITEVINGVLEVKE